MKGKLILMAAAAGAGYVAGTRAGRERYEQIRSRLSGMGLRLPGAQSSGMSSSGTPSPEHIDLRRTDAAMAEVREDTLGMGEKVQSNLHETGGMPGRTSPTEPWPTI